MSDKYDNYSVLMSVYAKENPSFLRISIDSMLNQTIPTNDFVLICDGPLPLELDSVIDDYCHKFSNVFQVVRLKKNVGLGKALSAGVQYCKNELIARMDSDDISSIRRCELQLEAFNQHPNLAVVGGNITEFIDSPDNVVGRRVVPESDEDIKKYLKTRCPLNHVSVMFCRREFEKAGGYQDWFCNEDYYLWIRMYLSNAIFANVPKDLVNVRVGKEMYQRRGGWKYFASEAKLQGYMLSKKIISFPTYISNVTKRLIVQVLLPNSIRGWVFRKFARTNAA